MSIWISISLLVVTIFNAGLALLVLGAPRRQAAHYWFSIMLAGFSVWAFGIMQFLAAQHNIEDARNWVQVYYIAAATLVFGVFQFSLLFPRKIRLSFGWHVAAAAAYAATCAVVVSDSGIISSVVLDSHSQNVVNLRMLWYGVYIVYFMFFAIATLANLGTGIKYASVKHRRHLKRQLKTLMMSAVVALILGSWFNLILPLFDNYQLIWIGPIGTLVLTGASLYAVARQGLFDLRQALMRSIAYLLLFGSLMLMYGALLQVLSQVLTGMFVGGAIGEMFTRVVLVLVLVFTIVPLKRFFDSATSRIFYRDRYDMGRILESIRQVVRTEVKMEPLVTRSTRFLEHAFMPKFTIVYIVGSDGEVTSYDVGKQAVKSRQVAAHRTLIEKHLDELAQVGDVRDIDHLRRSAVAQLLVDGHVGAFMRLDGQRQSVGLVFFGRKVGQRLYDDEDLKLLSITGGELGLAVQNSLRYKEIEAFTQTLEDRVKAATRELRSSNTKLQQLDESKDEFISMASHQLRTPLTSIKGYIDMVLEGDAGPINDVQKKFLLEAFSSSERMVHVINDFLNVSRLQTGKFMIEPTAVDLKTVVRQEVDNLQTTAGSRGLTLHYQAPATMPQLELDEGKIRQVIMNFVDNAIYYSREGTAIDIVLRAAAGQVTFEVHDTGIGVPASEQKELFGKFFRASNARKHRPDGTGVGLFLAKKVVTAHGGDVIFRAPRGGGSIFGFRLPVAKLRASAENTD